MTRIKVAVTGASGRTGRLVVQRLLLEPESYEPVAVVRSSKAAEEMTALFAAAAAAAAAARPTNGGSGGDNTNSKSSGSGSVQIVDFAQGLTPDTREEEDEQTTSEAELKLRAAFRGCRAVVVASSAVAEPKAWASLASAAHVAASRFLSAALGRAPLANAAFVPVATWKGGQAPREVDWLGARRIFRAFSAALAEGEEQGENEGGGASGSGSDAIGVGGHIVLIGSAGGCDPKHFLNRIAGGEVLNWKRRAEQDLVRMCEGTTAGAATKTPTTKGGGAAAGEAAQAPTPSPPPASNSNKTTVMTYTILHPNHLIDSGRAPKPGALPRSVLEFFDPTTLPAANPAALPRLPHQRLLLAVDDALQRPHWSRRPRVPRACLAELSVQCVALARPAGCGGWCRWEEGGGKGGATGEAAALAPARDRSIDVGVAEGKKAAAGAAAAGAAEAAVAAAEAVAAEAAAAAAAAAAAPCAAGTPAGMTRLFAALLRAMPRDCDYGVNDRTAPGDERGTGGLQWACR